MPEASLPIDERDGGVPVAPLGTLSGVGPHEAALVHEPLPRLVARVALPAVASNLLMTLFLAVDAFWVGTRLGATALAAVTAAGFWGWVGVSGAGVGRIGPTAVAAPRHGGRRGGGAARG